MNRTVSVLLTLTAVVVIGVLSLFLTRPPNVIQFEGYDTLSEGIAAWRAA